MWRSEFRSGARSRPRGCRDGCRLRRQRRRVLPTWALACPSCRERVNGRHRSGLESPSGISVTGHAPRGGHASDQANWWARPVPATTADRSNRGHAAAARSSASHAEVTGTEPGGSPSGSTATTLTDLQAGARAGLAVVSLVLRQDVELLV